MRDDLRKILDKMDPQDILDRYFKHDSINSKSSFGEDLATYLIEEHHQFWVDMSGEKEQRMHDEYDYYFER